MDLIQEMKELIASGDNHTLRALLLVLSQELEKRGINETEPQLLPSVQ